MLRPESRWITLDCLLANELHWTETCEGVYPDSVILYNWINAISLHSGRSIDFLFQRRQSLTRSYTAGDITNWPYSEPFIATEMHNNGFVMSKLADYGKVEKYNWWPPHHEKDLPLLQDQEFLHPVLDERKYVTSCLRYARLHSYFFPNGQLRRLLELGARRHLVHDACVHERDHAPDPAACLDDNWDLQSIELRLVEAPGPDRRSCNQITIKTPTRAT